MIAIGRVLLVLLALLLSAASAQEQERITLLPYTSEGYGFDSVIPEGWTDLAPGVSGRNSSDTDPTVIAQQSFPAAADEVLESLLPQLLLTEAPESAGVHQGAALDWTLYQVDVSSGPLEVRVDLALAEADGVTYIVILQTAPDDYDTLHDDVFLPTLDAFTPLEESDEPVPYDVEDVTFDNGDVTLAGTLTVPPTEGPHPVIVLVSGSGAQDRDESLGMGIAIKPFRLLADALTRAGVGVLRYDDRGVGESTGAFSTATTQDFATDAEAAIAYLLTRDDVDPGRIGLLGHSEGGLVAAMLGARNDDLDFIISLAGPGVIGREVLILQNQRIFEAMGASEEEIAAQLDFVDELTAVLDDPEAIEALTYEHTLAQLEALPDEQRVLMGDLEQQARLIAQQSAQQYSSAWFESFLAYDPAPDWAQTTVPVLAIFGGKDVQVDAEQNAPALEASLQQAGNEDFEIVILPDANHLFQVADTGSLMEYATLPGEFTPDLLPAITDWLEGVGVRRG